MTGDAPRGVAGEEGRERPWPLLVVVLIVAGLLFGSMIAMKAWGGLAAVAGLTVVLLGLVWVAALSAQEPRR